MNRGCVHPWKGNRREKSRRSSDISARMSARISCSMRKTSDAWTAGTTGGGTGMETGGTIGIGNEGTTGASGVGGTAGPKTENTPGGETAKMLSVNLAAAFKLPPNDIMIPRNDSGRHWIHFIRMASSGIKPPLWSRNSRSSCFVDWSPRRWVP